MAVLLSLLFTLNYFFTLKLCINFKILWLSKIRQVLMFGIIYRHFTVLQTSYLF